MEDRTTTPTAAPTRLPLASLIGDIERRRDEVQQQHEAARVRCLLLEDDLKVASEKRDDAASRYNELTAQIAYLRSLAQAPAAQQQPAA